MAGKARPVRAIPAGCAYLESCVSKVRRPEPGLELGFEQPERPYRNNIDDEQEQGAFQNRRPFDSAPARRRAGLWEIAALSGEDGSWLAA